MIRQAHHKCMKKEKGFAIFIAIAITGTLLLVSTAVVTVALKEAKIAAAGRESQYAFYAADTGMECALFWDVHQGDDSFFAPSNKQDIKCNGQNIVIRGNTNSVTIFNLNLTPEPYCAKVRVTKNLNNTTLIESYGYNTCVLSARRVERAVRASY